MYTNEWDNHEHNQQHDGYHSLLDNPSPRLILNDLFKGLGLSIHLKGGQVEVRVRASHWFQHSTLAGFV
jgi:hypothetical protein